MTTIKVVTQFNANVIKQHDLLDDTSIIGNYVERVIHLREQGVQEALSKLGYLNPEEAAKQQEEIESLKEQLKPANIQQFFTFAAIEDMSTKQINEVFTGLHESNISAMAKEKVNQERITKLEADIKMLREVLDSAHHMLCEADGNCLGRHHKEGNKAPTFIRDDALYGISKALEATKQEGGE